MEPAYRYRATCKRVIDGDTFVLTIDLGFRTSVELEARLHGVDCPELRDPGGPEARDYAAALLDGQALVIESYRNRRTFARWVADIYVGDTSLADAIVAAGHGTRIGG